MVRCCHSEAIICVFRSVQDDWARLNCPYTFMASIDLGIRQRYICYTSVVDGRDIERAELAEATAAFSKTAFGRSDVAFGLNTTSD